MVLLGQILAIIALAAIVTLLIIYNYKEFKYRKKIDFLTHLVDKGYESENIDLNNI